MTILFSIIGFIVSVILYEIWLTKTRQRLYKREKPKSDPPSPRKKQDYLPPVNVPPMPKCNPPKGGTGEMWPNIGIQPEKPWEHNSNFKEWTKNADVEINDVSDPLLDYKKRQDTVFEKWVESLTIPTGPDYILLKNDDAKVLSKMVAFCLNNGYHTLGSSFSCHVDDLYISNQSYIKGGIYFFQAVEK